MGFCTPRRTLIDSKKKKKGMVERVRAVHRRTHSRTSVVVSTCVPLFAGGTLNQFKKKKKKKKRDPNIGEFWNGGKRLVADARKGESRPFGGKCLAFSV